MRLFEAFFSGIKLQQRLVIRSSENFQELLYGMLTRASSSSTAFLSWVASNLLDTSTGSVVCVHILVRGAKVVTPVR